MNMFVLPEKKVPIESAFFGQGNAPELRAVENIPSEVNEVFVEAEIFDDGEPSEPTVIFEEDEPIPIEMTESIELYVPHRVRAIKKGALVFGTFGLVAAAALGFLALHQYRINTSLVSLYRDLTDRHFALKDELASIEVLTEDGSRNMRDFLSQDTEEERFLVARDAIDDLIGYSSPIDGENPQTLIGDVKRGIGDFKAGRANGRKHLGLDIPVPVNTPLISMSNGEVVYAGDFSTHYKGKKIEYGNTVMVQYGRNLLLYAHLNNIDCEVGQEVVGGKTILGKVGMTGNLSRATNEYSYSHVHIEVRKNSTFSFGSINGEKAIDPALVFSLTEEGDLLELVQLSL